VSDIDRALQEINERGLTRRMRMVSGPQGPRVLLDGKPVLMLASDNYLGLADHPRVREAAAEAAMRYGAGAGAARTASGTMRIHRRLEERLTAFGVGEAALLFGSRYLVNVGVIPALAGEGQVVVCDSHSHASIEDGCRLSRAETFVYRHGDLDHLAWGLERAEGRASLIVTDGVFGIDGDAAPLAGIVELADRHDTRVMVDDSHGIAATGPGGRGSGAAAGVEHEIDILVGSLGKSLGSYGAYVSCDRKMARFLTNAASTLSASTALPPPSVAAAMAALELLCGEPRRIEKVGRNAAVLREALAGAGMPAIPGVAAIVSVSLAGDGAAGAASQRAVERGVLIEAEAAPGDAAGQSRLRLAVMATHTKAELRQAARTLADCVPSAARRAPTQPVAVRDAGGVFDGLAQAA